MFQQTSLPALFGHAGEEGPGPMYPGSVLFVLQSNKSLFLGPLHWRAGSLPLR